MTGKPRKIRHRRPPKMNHRDVRKVWRFMSERPPSKGSYLLGHERDRPKEVEQNIITRRIVPIKSSRYVKNPERNAANKK